MDLPNYDLLDESPPLDDPGIVIRLAAPSCGPGEPAILYGAYELDAASLRLIHGDELCWISVVAVRRDSPAIATKAARPAGPSDMAPPIPPGSTASEGGWFNLDLRAHLNLAPGRYWVAVFLLDHRTD